MPLPGDQHKDNPNGATTNPFIDPKAHITQYTAAEIATLQSRLEKQLGPEYVSTRPGAGGGKVHYLAAEKAINLANEVFGFNGWSSSIQQIQIDFCDENATNGKISLGLSTIVRVTLRDGTFHEDIGYGHIENCKGKAAAFEKAKKEGATDAMKRALRNFGNVLGNCLYDKDYLQKVQKLKVAPSRWDADNLYRHPDFAPIKRESLADVAAAEALRVQKRDGGAGSSAGQQRHASIQSSTSFGSIEFEDDFGGTFDETDFSHPDEMRLDDTTVETPAKKAPIATSGGPAQSAGQQRQALPRMHSMPQIRPPNNQSPAPPPLQQPQQRPQGPQKPHQNAPQVPSARMLPPMQTGNHQRPGDNAPSARLNQLDGSGLRSNPSSGTTTTTATDSPSRPPNVPPAKQDEHDQPQGPQTPRMPPSGIPEGFLTGRSAHLLLNQSLPPGQVADGLASTVAPFNPHAETPSIRRTQGVNPGKSAPVMRSNVLGTGALPAAAAAANSEVPQQQQPEGPQRPPLHTNATTTPVRTTSNFVNPSADLNRRIGMPPPMQMQNRNAYRPPMRGHDAAAGGLKRPPLTDVSNLQHQQVDGAGDGGVGGVKKAKLDLLEKAAVAGEVGAGESGGGDGGGTGVEAT